MSPVNRLVFKTREGHVGACSCLLDDGRVVLCKPNRKVLAKSWSRPEIRHSNNKEQMVFNDINEFGSVLKNMSRRAVGGHINTVERILKRIEKKVAAREKRGSK